MIYIHAASFGVTAAAGWVVAWFFIAQTRGVCIMHTHLMLNC
jgi:hypothetical protein